MKLPLKITFLALITALWLLLHYFKNSSISDSPSAVKQQLLDEVATARLALASASTRPAFLESRPPHLFIFAGNKEIYWADNRTPATDSLLKLEPGFVSLENGIYLLHKKSGDTTYLYLKIIQEIPRVRNRYIEPYHMFHGDLSLTSQPGATMLDLGQQKVYFTSIPVSVSSFQLFNPEYFASSQWNPSLGFLLVNLLWLTAALLVLFEAAGRFNKNLRWFLATVSVIGCGTLCIQLCISLVYDSKLNLEFFNFNSLSLIDLLVPLLIIWFSGTFFFLFNFYRQNCTDKKQLIWLAVLLIHYNVLMYGFEFYDLLEINWFIPILIFPLISLKNRNTFLSWDFTIALVTVAFGWYFILHKHERYHLQDEERLISEKLAQNNDPVAEYLINDELPGLELRFSRKTDSISPGNFLQENLFLGYLSKYDGEVIPDSSDLSSSFYFPFNGVNYRLKNRYNTGGFGFPELLANREFANYYEKGFSTARFDNGRLFQSSGSYIFKKSISLNLPEESFIEKNGFLHFVKKIPGETIVVSYAIAGYFNNFATAAYLFLLALLGALPWISKRPQRLSSLQGRIQFTFLSLVLMTVLVFGASTYLYLFDQFTEKNKLNLSEKIRSVETELQSRGRLNLQTDRQLLENQLRKLAEIFFTDISLYDLNGKLIASSQPDIFSKGALSTQMEPEAYKKLSTKGVNLVIQTESIGKLDYLSAYKPFSDEHSHTIAYINLPYFAKQLELNKQLSNFLVSTITALVLLTAIALALAIFLSTRITEPLKTIRMKLQAIDLKKENQQIDYPANDEIGELVNAYNTKVKELIQKANQLAQSERESAWREMAKQVAHEIKNPLTPIKLNAQLLQRKLDSGDENIQEKTRDFIAGLIDQVNTLSRIANEFSNYASLPKSIETKVELGSIVRNVLNVMSQENIRVESVIPDEEQYVMADKELMVRVINNLVKNAVHAMEEKTYTNDQSPLLSVRLTTLGNDLELTISDNGTGIPEEMRDKIFSPNFTTKSTGMGLGLAMVRQILEQAGGSIRFETSSGTGTSFIILLPQMH